jgi:hypothetical protein
MKFELCKSIKICQNCSFVFWNTLPKPIWLEHKPVYRSILINKLSFILPPAMWDDLVFAPTSTTGTCSGSGSSTRCRAEYMGDVEYLICNYASGHGEPRTRQSARRQAWGSTAETEPVGGPLDGHCLERAWRARQVGRPCHPAAGTRAGAWTTCHTPSAHVVSTPGASMVVPVPAPSLAARLPPEQYWPWLSEPSTFIDLGDEE